MVEVVTSETPRQSRSKRLCILGVFIRVSQCWKGDRCAGVRGENHCASDFRSVFKSASSCFSSLWQCRQPSAFERSDLKKATITAHVHACSKNCESEAHFVDLNVTTVFVHVSFSIARGNKPVGKSFGDKTRVVPCCIVLWLIVSALVFSSTQLREVAHFVVAVCGHHQQPPQRPSCFLSASRVDRNACSCCSPRKHTHQDTCQAVVSRPPWGSTHAIKYDPAKVTSKTLTKQQREETLRTIEQTERQLVTTSVKDA